MSGLNLFGKSVLHLSKPAIISVLLLESVFLEQISAQQLSKNHDFSIAHTAGCTPFTVTPKVKFTGSTGSVQYFYFNKSNPLACTSLASNPTKCVSHPDRLTSDRTYTYSQPGIYYLIQILATSTTPRVDFIKITVVEDRSPLFEVATCNDNVARLTFDFSKDAFDFYHIDFGDGNKKQLSKEESPKINHPYKTQGTYIISVWGGLSSGLRCKSVEEKKVTTMAEVPVPVPDSLVVQSQHGLTLYFQPLDSRWVYRLEIDKGGGFESFRDISPKTNSRSFQFSDPALDHFTKTYRFRIVATDFCSSISHPSVPIASIALSYSLSSFNNGIRIALKWQTSSSGFNVLRYYVNGVFQRNFDTPANTSGFPVTFKNCTEMGRIYLKHEFNGRLSKSIEIIPFKGENLDLPAIPAPVGVLDDGGVSLSFSKPPFQATAYRIFRKDENGTFQQIGTTKDRIFKDTEVPGGDPPLACYAVQYVDECGNIAKMSEQHCIAVSAAIQLPNAFSPNGDNINDTFTVGKGIFQSFEMFIYNRWGTLVFHTNNPAVGWEGTFEGQPAAAGTYTYKITFSSTSRTSVTKTGTFILIR